MKRVQINKQRIGLLYRNGDFEKVLTFGNYWVRFGDTIKLYDESKIYAALEDMEVVAQNVKFTNAVEQFNVKDNEIALVFERGNFSSILTTGNYFYFKSSYDIKIELCDLSSTEEINSIDQAVLKNQQVAQYIKTFKVENYEKGLLFINGAFVKEVSAGSYFYWFGINSLDLVKVDVRTSLMEISGQELLTKDKVALRLNFQVEYKVIDAQKAIIENSSYFKQLYAASQLSLREVIGSLTLDELLQSKEKVGDFVLAYLESKAESLGVAVSQAGIRDIILPGEVKDIMNQVLIAEKQAQANAIVRREETAATRNMLNTAKLMEENQILLKLKEMEYVEKIASKIGEIKLSNGGTIVEQLTTILSR